MLTLGPKKRPNAGWDVDMKQVIIVRRHWGKDALLRTDNHKQCCLGFVCEAYGITKDEMYGKGMPHQLPHELLEKLPKWLSIPQGDAAQASKINDSRDLTWEEKEARLRPLFRKHRIQLVFRGKR
jgi:hypothetical protein